MPTERSFFNSSEEKPMIEAKDILEWCFTVGALVFGVFGFLYSTYAAAMFQLTRGDSAPPPIAKDLKCICWTLTIVLLALTVTSFVTSYEAGVTLSVWAIVVCFFVLTVVSLILAYRMD
jgi:hypothetical protein